MSHGPLQGIKVVELGGIGPGPFAAMMLADLGAEVIRIDRSSAAAFEDYQVPELDLLHRSRRSVLLNLKRDEGREALRRLIDRADALIDPFRPGVAERLGIGPDECLGRNSRLVYGRMTGWGQEGPLATAAGHDLNYISLAGPMGSIGRRGAPPPPPLNLIGDFGGGGMLLVVGILAALLERAGSGRGQVIDAAMVDGSALLATGVVAMAAMGSWDEQREANLLDGGAHFYDTYETSDGGFISIGAIEPQFYGQLLERLGLDPVEWPQWDAERWPELSERLRAEFKRRTRAEWSELLEGTDVCFAPVLSFAEAAEHAHLRARGTYVEAFGVTQPAPAPRFDRTPAEISAPPCLPGEHSREVLLEWGFDAAEVDALERAGVTEVVERRAR